jgi:hypothetical protein
MSQKYKLGIYIRKGNSFKEAVLLCLFEELGKLFSSSN